MSMTHAQQTVTFDDALTAGQRGPQGLQAPGACRDDVPDTVPPITEAEIDALVMDAALYHLYGPTSFYWQAYRLDDGTHGLAHLMEEGQWMYWPGWKAVGVGTCYPAEALSFGRPCTAQGRTA